MATPNPSAKLRVLVCDNGKPDLNHQQPYLFDYLYSARSYAAVNAVERVLGNKVEVTRVDDFAAAVQAIKERQNPYYALFVIASYQITDQAGGFKLKTINDFNPFLPELIYGEDILRRNLAKGMRRGVRFYAENDEKLAEELRKTFYSPVPIKNLVVVKFGGSAFDHGIPNLRYAAEKVIEINRRKPLKRGEPKQRIISTVGAGRHGEVTKDDAKKAPEVRARIGNFIVDDLNANLKKLACLMPNGSYNLLGSEDFYFIHFEYLSKPALMATAPHYILARDGIPLEDSDTHTIAIAELFGAKRVVLIKRADGVYDFDPNFGGLTNDFKKWKRKQAANKRHAVVTVDDLISGKISREGTNNFGERDGSLGHLMEDSSLEYFAGCKTVEEILVVHIAPEEMYVPDGGALKRILYLLSGFRFPSRQAHNEFEHIVTGERLVVEPAGWKRVLEQRIEDAFNGIAFSKIIRNS